MYNVQLTIKEQIPPEFEKIYFSEILSGKVMLQILYLVSRTFSLELLYLGSRTFPLWASCIWFLELMQITLVIV